VNCRVAEQLARYLQSAESVSAEQHDTSLLKRRARTAKRDQYWVLPPPLDAPLALSCLIRCSSMLEEVVAPL
jgi:hypothetical protein